MSSSVEDWLRSLGLIQYTQSFLDNGYDELDICKEIGEEDLDAIGVGNIKDRVDILGAVMRLKQSGGTAVYFVLEEGSQPTPPTQTRENIIPLKLKMLLRDTLEEDGIHLTDLPYTLPSGVCGNLDNLITLYADKFYTFEEDVLEALESIRARQVGELKEQSKQTVHEDEATYQVTSRVPNTTAKHHQHKRSNTTPLNAVTKESAEWHTAPPAITTKGLPADYLDIDSTASPHKKVKRRRPVERNSKLSRSLDSLKELHVNTVELKTKEKDHTKPKQSSIFGLFRSSKRKIIISQEDKSSDNKSPTDIVKSATGTNFPASNITMGEEDRVTLMLMVKQGELTVEEAVEQLESYEKEHKKGQKTKQEVRRSGSCSEEESSSNKSLKLKRGLFGRSTKKKPPSRPASEIAACDMTMSEEDRIKLMRGVRDHEITVEEAVQKLLSFEEESPLPKTKINKHKFSPKSPHSFSRLSIKRVSGAFSSAVKSTPQIEEPSAVFYTPQEAVANTSSEDDSHWPSDSSPDPSPGGNRKTIHGKIRNAQHHKIQSTSSLHSSSSSSDAVDRLGTIEDSEHRSVQKDTFPFPSPPDQRFLNEMQSVFSKRGALEQKDVNKDKDLSPVHGSTLPRNGRPAARHSLNRKSSLPNELPAHCHVLRKAPPPPPPRTLPRQSTAPSLQIQPTSPASVTSNESMVKHPPLIPPRRRSFGDNSKNIDSNISEENALPQCDSQTSPSSYESDEIRSSLNNRISLEDDVFPPPPAELLLDESSHKVEYRNIIAKPPRPLLKGAKPDNTKNDSQRPVVTGISYPPPPPPPPGTKPKPAVKRKPRLPPKPPKPVSVPEQPELAEPESSLGFPGIPVPRKRPSHSLADLIERRLRIEQIDLTESPYSSDDGEWGVPINLIDRYTEEMRRSQKEVIDVMEKIRCLKLNEKNRPVIPCNMAVYPQEPDHLGQLGTLEDWLVSLGLPMYVDNLKEVEYDDMNAMPYLKQKHFEYAGVVDLRHMRRLLASVERMPR